MNKKAQRALGWKSVLGIAGIWALASYLTGGAIASVFLGSSSPLLVLTIALFLLYWLLKK